ncbi:hypothetical protein BaRGS_00030912, partial [Batillaria attramentaria]
MPRLPPKSTHLMIRLALHGCTNRPFYHVVVMPNRSNRNALPLEQIGSYDPMPNIHQEKLVAINFERLRHWIASGAQCSKAVQVLLGMSGFLPLHPMSIVVAQRRRKRAQDKRDNREGSNPCKKINHWLSSWLPWIEHDAPKARPLSRPMPGSLALGLRGRWDVQDRRACDVKETYVARAAGAVCVCTRLVYTAVGGRVLKKETGCGGHRQEYLARCPRLPGARAYLCDLACVAAAATATAAVVVVVVFCQLGSSTNLTFAMCRSTSSRN